MGKDTELLNNKKLGDLGERIAKIYLEINKYQILKCNFRSTDEAIVKAHNFNKKLSGKKIIN